MERLFGLLETVDGVQTCSRRMRLWSNMTAAEKPAIFLAEHKETIERSIEGLPPLRKIMANIFVYIDSTDPECVPITAMNNIIDAIFTALRPQFPAEEQTLGGLVAHCWIEGEILKDPGDLDGYGIAILPVSIVLP